MMNGTVIRVLKDKGFGFIRSDDGREYFFHTTDFNGFFDDLADDMQQQKTVKVTFEDVPSQKGLRAGRVTRDDGGFIITDEEG